LPEAHTLDIEHLVVRYYGREDDALRDVSLAVRPGELMSVAGANGAGKSTLALAAAGLIPRIVRAQVSGRVSIDGELAVDQHTHGGSLADRRPGSRRHGYRAGIVFPNPANQLSGTKTSVREEIAFGLENLGVPRDEMDARIDRVLEDLDIAHLADRLPYAVSGGEQQRVAIASIIAMGLPLLVLDEPTAQLDPLATRSVADHLVRLAGEGVAILVAEHAPAVLARTQRTVVLHDGRIATLAAPGRALQPDALAGTGLESPTLVALAAAAGVAADAAFDEAAIAAALRQGGARQASAGAAQTASLAIPAWESVREAAPVAIQIRDLVHRYPNGLEALRGVSLEIPAGQAVAIVGQNGSGKTTLVKHLDGLLRATSGDVRIGGASVAQVPVHRIAATVGFVFQNPDDQLFSRSVERELHFGPRNLGLPKATADRLVAASLEAIGLTADRAANPYDLNVSARKLIALGSVLATDPAVLVLDEPTTGQDAPGIARVGAVVDALGAAGRTVIAISHDMEFAARHFERVVVMRQGEVMADGPPGQALSAAAANLLETTGLTPPPAARIAGLLGLDGAPGSAAELLELIERNRVAE
jgi:energy-coupling factor transport system ATP-binding protein